MLEEEGGSRCPQLRRAGKSGCQHQELWLGPTGGRLQNTGRLQNAGRLRNGGRLQDAWSAVRDDREPCEAPVELVANSRGDELLPVGHVEMPAREIVLHFVRKL